MSALAFVSLYEEASMKNPAVRNAWKLAALLLAFCLMPNFVFGTEWKQTASVRFVDMPWGRFTQITIEHLPDLGGSIEEVSEYMDPAKRAELMSEMQDEINSGRAEEVGRTIMITVLGLDYGMTGVWSNVRIESGNGISIPADQAHVGSATSWGETGESTYTGELIISEFTEDVIRGSYRAELFNSDASRREFEAGKRDYLGEVVGDLDFDLSAMDAPDVQLAEAPEPDDLSDSDAELLERIKAAGVPADLEGQFLESLKGMDPAMQKMILESQSDSY